MLTVIGLGTEKGDLTLSGLQALKQADKVIVRTSQTDSVKTLDELGIEYSSLDYLYEKSRNFDTLAKNICQEVVKEAKSLNVVYAVDGAVSDDISCKFILNKFPDAEVINGVGKHSGILTALKVYGGYTTVSAYDVKSVKRAVAPLIVFDVDGEYLASVVKLYLSEMYGDEKKVKLLINGKVEDLYLYEIDGLNGYDYKTTLYIPDDTLTEKTKYDITDLIDILRYLRSDDGCPWDREQTKESVRHNLIEECYELIDAINRDDEDGMVEEIGDVFMQLAFHLVFAEERHAFTYYDALTGVCEKLISRHSHIFGTDKAETSGEVLKLWEENKKKEKHYSTGGEYVKSVPSCMPATMRAEKVMNRAAKYNFEFDNVEQIFDKIKEEIEEVRAEIKSGNKDLLQKECGDLLCSAVNAVRYLGFECEETLTLSIEKFIDRFTKLEQAVLSDGKDMKTLSAKERDDYYDAVKRFENR